MPEQGQTHGSEIVREIALIGEPGVGKTAIVEGLAERIVACDVPSTIKDKDIIELDMSAPA